VRARLGVLLGGLSAIQPEEARLVAEAVEDHAEEVIGRGPVRAERLDDCVAPGGDVGVEVLIDERAGGKAPADAPEGARDLAVGRGVLEALNPFEENAVECAIRGRVDDAVEDMIETPAGEIASRFTAPHPVERGHTLVRFESVVYKCENDHAIMLLLAGITPMSQKASCSFNYNEAKPNPGWMLESINDFIVMQGLGHLGL
jgi:hypothetical protein